MAKVGVRSHPGRCQYGQGTGAGPHRGSRAAMHSIVGKACCKLSQSGLTIFHDVLTSLIWGCRERSPRHA
eukprot:1187079-Prorocentrum_minimum.AAC.3